MRAIFHAPSPAAGADHCVLQAFIDLLFARCIQVKYKGGNTFFLLVRFDLALF